MSAAAGEVRRPATATDGLGQHVDESVRGPQGSVLAQFDPEPLAAAGQDLELVDPTQLEQIRSDRRRTRPCAIVLSGGGVPGTGRNVGPLALLARAQLLARRAGPRIVVPQAQPTTERLEKIAELVQSGSLVPVIDRVFALDDGAEAVRYVETEHARGKVIITIRVT